MSNQPRRAVQAIEAGPMCPYEEINAAYAAMSARGEMTVFQYLASIDFNPILIANDRVS